MVGTKGRWAWKEMSFTGDPTGILGFLKKKKTLEVP